MGDWTFFSNYGHVLVCLAKNRQARLRDVAVEVGITERAVQKIVRDLQDEGFLTVSKQGRCNRYQINNRKTLRHPLVSHCTVGKLLALLQKPKTATAKAERVESPPPSVDEIKPGAEREPIAADSGSKPEKPSEADPEVEAGKPGKPVDTRQQGSLF